jgi:UDP:flavonoid glycosyltransferase YjiC (YdhE family)
MYELHVRHTLTSYTNVKIRPHASIGLGIIPYVAASNDTFPFRSGRQPDTSPDSQRIHFEAQQAQYRDHPIDTLVNKEMNTVLKELGAKQSTPSLYDAIALCSDIYLQYGVPAFEYKRSDWRPHLSFMGAPVAVGIAGRELPEWWDDVLNAKKAGQKIVAVSSSSAVFDTHALIKPALEALGERDDVFVIATLVTSDVENLDFKIPQNARVAKFIPLDLALPFVSIPNVGVVAVVNITIGGRAGYERRIRDSSAIPSRRRTYDHFRYRPRQTAHRQSYQLYRFRHLSRRTSGHHRTAEGCV